MTVPYSKGRLRPVIRIFVSSTFSDMKHERNALQMDVFPNLEKLCQENGFQFQAIDLRWGVSTEAGLDHRTMRICFDELRRCQEISPRPNFLILLGNRYGWRPLPEEISLDEFLALERAATMIGESAVAVLGKWYRRDESAVPLVYILQSRLPHSPDWNGCADNATWNQVQGVLWEIINRVMSPEQMRGRFDGAVRTDGSLPPIIRFQASATEQEIWQGALRVPDANEHVIAFFREIENIGEFADPKQIEKIKDFVDVLPSGGLDAGLWEEQERLKAHLLGRLGQANVFAGRAVTSLPASGSEGESTATITTEHLERFCSDLESRFKEIIQGQINEYWQQTKSGSAERARRELEIEQQEHARVSQERGGAEAFVGREAEMTAIHDYLLNDSTWPLVVHGASGCGKTALLSHAAHEAAALKPIVRLIGIHPRCSDLHGLLSSLCQELRLRHPREGELPTEIKLLEVELHEHFQAAAKSEQPLILFLDALDQLADTDGGRLLHWIPVGPLPANVKLVVSCLSDRSKEDPAGQPWIELQRRQLPASQFDNLDAFSDDEARTLLFERWLPQVGRTVSPDQRARIEQRLATDACRQPIYLKLLFEEARLWRSYDAIPDLGEGVSALLDQLIKRLSQPTNHGPLLVERVLGYLAASRYGLAENEILEILFRDPEYKKALVDATKDTRQEMPTNATRIPIAIWSRLRFDLAPYLTERSTVGANVLAFYHRQVAEWAQEHFAKAPNQRWQPHPLLADYFRNQADPEDNQSWKCYNPRPFLQVVFHMVGAERSDDYCQTLCDLRFVEARCRVGQVFELIADYRLAQNNLLEAQADLREEHAREERMRRWTAETVEYARQLSNLYDRLDREEAIAESEPEVPAPVPSFAMWTEEQIRAECERIIKAPARLDRLVGFSTFVTSQCYPLLQYSGYEGFVLAHGFNYSAAGPVHEAAETLLADYKGPALMRRWTEAMNFISSIKPALLNTLVGHDAYIHCVSVTPDGKYAVSSDHRNILHFWQLDNGACIRTIERCIANTGLVVTPNARFAFSKGYDGRDVWQLWSLETGMCIRTISRERVYQNNKIVKSEPMMPRSRLRVLGEIVNNLRAWELEYEPWPYTNDTDSPLIDNVSITPDGRMGVELAFADLQVWDAQRSPYQRILKGHDNRIRNAAITSDGRHVVSASDDRTLRVWDLEKGKCIRVLEGHTNAVLCVRVTADGRLAVSGSMDGTLRVWDLASGNCLRILEGNSGITSLSITPDGRYAVTGNYDMTVRVWNLPDGSCIQAQESHLSRITSISASIKSNIAVSASVDSTLRLFELDRGRCLQVFAGHKRKVDAVVLTPDGKLAVSVSCEDKSLRLWDCQSGKCLRKCDSCGAIQVTPDGRHIFLVADSNVQKWNLDSGLFANAVTISPQRSCGSLPMITPDCRTLVWTDVLGGSEIWDLEKGECLYRIGMNGSLGSVTAVCLTSDRRRLVLARNIGIAKADSRLEVWDLHEKPCCRVLQGHDKYGVSSISLTNDSQYVVSSGSVDKTVRVWDAQSGRCIAVMCTGAWVGAVALCSRQVIVGCMNGEIILADIRNENNSSGETFLGA